MNTKVLVVGQTPPPYNGQAVMIERLVHCDLADVELIHVRMAFSSHMNELGRVRVSKILHMFGLIARIIFNRFAHGVRILYYPPGGADRVPMVRDIIILLSTRWLFDKTILHFHAGGVSELYDRLPSWQQAFFRRAYFDADAAIRLSELNPEDGRRLAAKRHFIIPNGIDDPCPGWTDSQSRPTVPKVDLLRLLFVGVLSEAKGVLVLIDACAKLAARGVSFRLELMGQWESDGFATRVQQRVHEAGLSNQVFFLGMLTGDAKFAAYHRANVFCFPTFMKCEALPVVLLEAMACGLPIVATRWRGIPSIVDERETGLLVEPRDADALAERLADLACDSRARERMGRGGRAKFEREYTFAKHADRMRRAMLETAGIFEAQPELDKAAHVRSRSHANTANCQTEADVEIATA
jgi:glycosyltransferase involved in cell wall biosynthesis